MFANLILAYGIACYVVFLAAFLYAVGFVAGIVVPKGIDTGTTGSVPLALIIDLVLLGLFAVQHSIMARPAFKKWWTQYVPKPAERSTFVLLSSLLLLLLYWLWRPLPAVVWSFDHPALEFLLYGAMAAGWLLVFLGTFVVDHFDLFGLRQVYLFWKGEPYTWPEFKRRGFYKYIRHPIMAGFMVAFWATPQMTVGHLLFAVMTTGYIMIGVFLEERDLVAYHPEYADYKREVPAFVPSPRTRGGGAEAEPTEI